LTINRIINAALQDTGVKKEWLEKIKLIITFGSPVDKFAALYPNTLVTFKSYGTGKISPKHLEACTKKIVPGTV